MEVTLTITMADPAGNRTAFVEGEVPENQYAAIGAELLKDPDLRAEQVGFICPPHADTDTAGRLEMMGGEFCGNASRSFGLLLGKRQNKENGSLIPIEVSGCSSRLNVLLEENEAWVSMPLPQKIIEIAVPSVLSEHESSESNESSELSEMLYFPAVVFEGITHVILENTPVSEELAHAVIKEAARKTNAEAAGAIFVSEQTMTPAVWVRATDSFVWESSCGSGTLAAAVWLGRNKKNSAFRLSLKQPGGILKAEIISENGNVTEAKIGGPVFLEDPIEKTILI